MPDTYVITVHAYRLNPGQIDELCDRISDAAHALDEDVIVSGGYEDIAEAPGEQGGAS